jgi:hypothetical protein
MANKKTFEQLEAERAADSESRLAREREAEQSRNTIRRRVRSKS